MRLAEEETKQKEEDRRLRREVNIRRMEHKEDTEEQLRRRTQQQKYAIGIKGRVGPMIDMCSSDPRRIAPYFQLIEGVFDKFQVKDSLNVEILLSKLDVKMRNVMNELNNDERYDYEVVKQHILQRCRFSPMKLRDEFCGSRKSKDETFPALAARLHSYLRLYFQSRQAESFDRALSLLDKLNSRWQKTETKKGPVSVSGCYSCGNTGHLAEHYPKRIKNEPVKRIMKCKVNQMLDGTVNEQAQDGVGKRVQVGKFFKRPFVKVQVQGRQFCHALVDSGAEVCCISKKLFDALNLERMGQLRIVGLDGQSKKVDATWVTVTPQIKHCEVIAPSVEVRCAIIPDAHEKLLITPDVVERLKGTE
ncbi:hypothetical protein HELRODRAFT_160345 [Helobdella robusta]|uniref:Uncharacterized protein n=1 Tax=Helobdella robusta TaxID=6412 RepID=T1EQ45_HELRO|nr:hypothetical protein HELRODRAFT_160345 [Helobdella robusta]ESO06191.1 hypothetical protein HELRODRAFT_160345 [Helobdella robusta]